MNNKIYKKLFVGFGFVIIVLILTLFVMSQTYIQNLVYHERLSQMEEVTHQMFHSLEDVIDNHWDDVDVQCNYLAYTSMETTDDLFSYLEKLSELANYKEKQIELVAVDSVGHYYTAHGRMGLLRGMTYLESAPERVSYVSNSLTVDDSRMVFLKQLSTPITLQSETGEITLRYFGISQSMTQLNDYFRCDAYENNNSVYVLDNDGFKLFNANDTELLKGHNVYTVLSRMSYLHGSSFAEAKERLDRTGSCYSNAVLDGTEYFYALKQMENARWTLAFLVPAEYVAVNTQKLVNIVMVIIIVIAMVFSVITVFVGWSLLRQKQQQELQAEKEANLRLEQYNIQLTQANDELRQAQDIAAEALQSAERASKAKTDFLANMSHDIRLLAFPYLAEHRRNHAVHHRPDGKCGPPCRPADVSGKAPQEYRHGGGSGAGSGCAGKIFAGKITDPAGGRLRNEPRDAVGDPGAGVPHSGSEGRTGMHGKTAGGSRKHCTGAAGHQYAGNGRF